MPISWADEMSTVPNKTTMPDEWHDAGFSNSFKEFSTVMQVRVYFHRLLYEGLF